MIRHRPPEQKPSIDPTKEKKETASDVDHVDEIPTDSLEQPRVIEARFGPVVFGTHEGIGYSKERRRERIVNQDALVVNTDANGFAVIDGLGGEAAGEHAARILAEEIQGVLRTSAPLEQAHEHGHARMNTELTGNGGACYIAVRVENGTLKIAQAGDVRLCILGRTGRIRFETKDQGGGTHVYNGVFKSDQTLPTVYEKALFEGDRIIIGSDGIFKNISTDELHTLASGKSTPDGFMEIQGKVLEQMKSDNGHPDNATLVIFEIAHGSEFEAIDDLSLDILSMQSFDELYELLREIQVVKTSKKGDRVWSSDELIQCIEEVRTHRRPLTDVPIDFRLRRQVNILLQQEDRLL